MTIVVTTPPTTEPLTASEVKQFCRIDVGNQEPPPVAFTGALAGAGAGNVDNGDHRYLATFVTATGETQAGASSAAVTVANKTVDGKVSLTAIPLGGAAITARKLYRTAAGGSNFMLLTTIADNSTTTFTDNVADSSLGVGAPTSNTTEDPLIALLIVSARYHAEQELRRFLITQTVDAFFDHFPRFDRFMDYLGMGNGGGPSFGFGGAYSGDYQPGRRNPYDIVLPPLSAVLSIKYIDNAGVQQTLDPSMYAVDANSLPSRISPAYGVSWPVTRWQPNAVDVQFTAGYGAASAVPACIKQWMLMRISTMYENREQLNISPTRSALVQLPDSYIDGLLDPERVGGRV